MQAFISEFPVWNWSSFFPSWRPLDILFTRQHFVALYDVQVLLVLKEEKEEEAKKITITMAFFICSKHYHLTLVVVGLISGDMEDEVKPW